MAFQRRLTLRGIEARDKLIKGANLLADCVKSTLGPFGQNFILEKGLRVTNDGLKVAQEISARDEIEDLGLRLVREATIKTNDEAGDGTTTATTLAQAILREALRYLDNSKVFAGKKTPVEVVRQVERERKEVTEKLNAMAKPIETEEELVNSARVAVEDDVLGEMIGKTQWALGKDGIMIAEETAERECYVETVKGIRIDNGFGTVEMITNQEDQSMEADDVAVILTGNTIRSLAAGDSVFGPLFAQCMKAGKHKVAIIARAFTAEAIQHAVINYNQGGFKIYPVNGPYTDMDEVMKDMAAVLGATYFGTENSDLSAAQMSDLGYASKIIAKRYTATIAGRDDDKTKMRIENRVIDLEKKLKGSKSEFEKKNLQARIAQLKSGFALIKIGSVSDVERKRLYDKAEDAVNAVRAALQEGTVPGAGLAFKQISEELPDDYLLKRPLMSIYEQIMSMAPADFVIEDWVRDPVKVLRVALEKACSVAGTLSTAAGAVAQEWDKPTFVQKVDNTPSQQESAG